MFDFSYSSIDEMIELLARNINPFSGLKFKAREKKQVTEMMSIIYAAVNDEELYFDPVTAFIPTLDIGIIIKKSTSIQPFAKKIAGAIAHALKKYSEYFSQDIIQFSFCRFLVENGLIELRDNPYIENQQSYFATTLGENCGLQNKTTKTKKTKRHTLLYSAYMQVYLLRKFPDIFLPAIKAEFKKNHETLENYIEPLTVEEQELIVSYRCLDENGKKYLSDTMASLFNGFTGGKQKKIS